MAGLIKGLVKKKKEMVAKGEVYNSSDNFMFYGNGGKTATAAALSLYTDSPILFLSPSGSAEKANEEFENILVYQVDSLEELESVLNDINTDFQDAKKLQSIIAMGDTERLAKAKEVYESKGENWEEVLYNAERNIMPISGVVLEECNIVSNWIQEKCVVDLGLDGQIGDDKSMLGKDWNYLKKQLNDFYTRVLKFPGYTILSTGDREPGEKQNLKQIAPDSM